MYIIRTEETRSWRVSSTITDSKNPDHYSITTRSETFIADDSTRTT